MSIELNTGAPRERAELIIDPSGIIELVLGTTSAGQGHETSFAEVIAEWLGAEPASHPRQRRPCGARAPGRAATHRRRGVRQVSASQRIPSG